MRHLRFVPLTLLAMAATAMSVACSGDGGPLDATPEATSTEVPADDAAPASGAASAGDITFESDRVEDGVTEVYAVNADGTALTQLTASGAAGHDWSLDGGRIAFSSAEPFLESPHDIFVMNADGSGLESLTDDLNLNFLPKWSPDGGEIAFLSVRDGNREIYVMNADGSGQANLTEHPADDSYGVVLGLSPLFSADPWSPDGSRLAFNRTSVNGEPGDPEVDGVYVMNADGSNQTRIADIPALFAGWSADGEKLLLYSAGEEGAEIFVINADGTDLTTLISLPGENPQGFPVWSPDGEKIAFTADRDGNDAIYAMNADGSDVTPLTTGAGATGFEGCDGLFGTAWSPDGERIAFTSGCDFERAVVMVVNADGSGETRIADAPAFSPAWVPGQ